MVIFHTYLDIKKALLIFGTFELNHILLNMCFPHRPVRKYIFHLQKSILVFIELFFKIVEQE